MSGRIEIILGCMFSGKSTELMRRISRYEAIGHKTLIINSSLDSRTGDSIKTHTNRKKEALKCKQLMNIIKNPLFTTAKVIGIDEAQFFSDIREFLLETESLNKIFIISGLDGDSERRPFGKILDCIPLCDEVTKLTAMDMVDKDGTPAIFTKRIIDNEDQICIGTAGDYIAVARHNYKSPKRNS